MLTFKPCWSWTIAQSHSGVPRIHQAVLCLLAGDWKESLSLWFALGNDIFGGHVRASPTCPCWSILQAAGWGFSTWGRGRRQPFLFSPGSPAKCPRCAQSWCRPFCWAGQCQIELLQEVGWGGQTCTQSGSWIVHPHSPSPLDQGLAHFWKGPESPWFKNCEPHGLCLIILCRLFCVVVAFLLAQLAKNLPAMRKTWVWSLGWEDPLEKGKATTPVFWPGEFHALFGPWGHRVGHDWVTFAFMSDSCKCMYCRLPGSSAHGICQARIWRGNTYMWNLERC